MIAGTGLESAKTKRKRLHIGLELTNCHASSGQLHDKC
jgi:hypothetical protein